MITLVMLAALAGQLPPCGPAGCPITVPASSRAAGLHVLADSSGKSWSSPDPAWLARWIGIENARLATAKAGQTKPENAVRPTQSPQATGPSSRFPTGVVASRLPHIAAGQAWYGGNVGADKPAAKIGAAESEDAGPDVYLSVIGGESERSAVMNDLSSNPGLADVVKRMGDRISIHDYSPDDPMVADVGLPDGGRPDIVIQDAGGKVRYRARDNPGPAVLVAELRKVDPQYNPANDPSGGWSLGSLDGFFGNAEEQAPVLMALAFLGFVVWWTH